MGEVSQQTEKYPGLLAQEETGPKDTFQNRRRGQRAAGRGAVGRVYRRALKVAEDCPPATPARNDEDAHTAAVDTLFV